MDIAVLLSSIEADARSRRSDNRNALLTKIPTLSRLDEDPTLDSALIHVCALTALWFIMANRESVAFNVMAAFKDVPFPTRHGAETILANGGSDRLLAFMSYDEIAAVIGSVLVAANPEKKFADTEYHDVVRMIGQELIDQQVLSDDFVTVFLYATRNLLRDEK